MTKKLLITGVAIAILIWILPSEWVKWQVAAAENAIEAGDAEAGLARINNLVQQDPKNLTLQLERLHATAATKNPKAVDELAEQLKLDFPNNGLLLAHLGVAYHTVGMHKESYNAQADLIIDDLRQIQAGNTELAWDTSQINNMAYASYLANEDTELWYQLIRQRLDAVSEVRFAIYRAEALRLVDKSNMSAAIMETELNRLEATRDQKEIKWRADLKTWMSSRDWPTPEPPTLTSQRALILNLRILISQIASQGWKSTEGTDDLELRERFRKAKAIDLMIPELESNGQETTLPIQELAVNNSPKLLCQNLRQLTTLFDTQGCLAMRQGDFWNAKRDLDNCVQAITLLQSLAESVDIWNSGKVVDVQQIERETQEERRSWAVILYHRSLLYSTLKYDSEVERDHQRIRELGFEPGPELF